MHDWSDNELDGMSREAADNYGPGRGMPDWDSLEKQLDKELPEHKEDNRRRFFFLIFLCVILTGVTSYLLISQNSGTKNSSNQISSNTTQQPGNISSEAKPGSDNTNPDRNQNAGSAAINKQSENDTTNNVDNEANKQKPTLTGKLSAPSSVENKKTRSALSLSTTSPNNSLNTSTGNNKSPGSKNKKTKNTSDGDLAITVESSSVNKNNISENKIAPGESEAVTAAAIGLTDVDKTTKPEAVDTGKPETDKIATDQTVKASDTAATDASVKKTTTVKSPQKGSAFEASLLAGIDGSNVKFKYSDDAGFNVGLLLGYRFNKKWSIGTGLIYTKKNYTAAGSDFAPPKSYWTNNFKIDKVDGSCYMWEIPVYASYHFNSRRKSGWFVSMGLSSYFMTKEDYTYYYKYNNGNPATRYWQNTDPSNYWFSVLGVSGGWEKGLGHGLSLGIAPYAKIPLNGVGFGNMQLSSYGLNLLLSYRKATGRK